MKQSLKRILLSIPSSLLLLRFVLGPLLLVSAFDCKEGHKDTPFGCPWFVIGFTAAFLSDVFDGIIARRLRVDTEKLREYDGWVDTWFYCWILVSAWILHFDALFALRIPLLLSKMPICS